MRQRGAACEGGGCGVAGASHIPKYICHFLTILLATFTTGLVFVEQSKQGIATLYFPKYLDQFLTVLLATFTTGLVFAR